jgi:hypothetical protein
LRDCAQVREHHEHYRPSLARMCPTSLAQANSAQVSTITAKSLQKRWLAAHLRGAAATIVLIVLMSFKSEHYP